MTLSDVTMRHRQNMDPVRDPIRDPVRDPIRKLK